MMRFIKYISVFMCVLDMESDDLHDLVMYGACAVSQYLWSPLSSTFLCALYDDSLAC